MKKVLSLVLVCVMVLSLGSAAFAASGKWVAYNGKYYYQKEDGNYAVNSVQQIGGKYYYFGSDGALKTGFQKIGSKYYYFGNDGAMKFRAQRINSKLYYFGDDGYMRTGWQFLDGMTYLYFGSDGALLTGINKIGGKWYYIDEIYGVRTGLITYNGKIYFFSRTDGSMQTGVKTINNKVYYFTGDGSAYIGWLQYGGNYYYFKEDGSMAANEVVGGYKFAANGVCTGKGQSSNLKASIAYNNGPQITNLKVEEQGEQTYPDGSKSNVIYISGQYVNNTNVNLSLIATFSASMFTEQEIYRNAQQMPSIWKDQIKIDDHLETLFGSGFSSDIMSTMGNEIYVLFLQMDKNYNVLSCVIVKVTK